jgi:dipeptidyl aminopeptidase/acylaminoacyl peptidase
MIVILAFACAAACPTPAAAPAAAPATLTAGDVVALEAAGEFHLSGDGRSLVWVKTAADLQRNLRRRRVHLTRLDGPETVQLTRGDDDRAPRFSIDGAPGLRARSARGRGREGD